MMFPRLKIILAALVALTAGPAFAADPHDIYVRTGLVSGAFNGKNLSSGTFSANINAEGEIWVYRSPSDAIVFRALLANQSNLGRTRYFGASAGQRFFLFADGMTTEQQFREDIVRVKPHWGVYAGYDIGLGNYLVIPFGDVLSAYSTTADVGAVVGVRHGLSEHFSFDALVGGTYSSSVLSTNSVTATTYRVLIGLGYTF